MSHKPESDFWLLCLHWHPSMKWWLDFHDEHPSSDSLYWLSSLNAGPLVPNCELRHNRFLTDSDSSQKFLNRLNWLHLLEYQIHSENLTIAFRGHQEGVWSYMIISADSTDGGSDRRNFIHAKLCFGDSHSWGHMLPDCYSTYWSLILGTVGCVMLNHSCWGQTIEWTLSPTW